MRETKVPSFKSDSTIPRTGVLLPKKWARFTVRVVVAAYFFGGSKIGQDHQCGVLIGLAADSPLRGLLCPMTCGPDSTSIIKSDISRYLPIVDPHFPKWGRTERGE
jgi:hypothetical protein